MSLNALPAELQQVVYDFDGRYKAAMARCFLIITQRRSTFREEKMGLLDEYYIDKYPQYYAEISLRAARYQSQMKNGMFRRVIHPSTARFFSDVIGVYVYGYVQHITLFHGKAYKSCSREDGVAIGFMLNPKSTITTVVKCIDVLDPVFQKSVNDVKEWRELGVSENGLPEKEYYKSIFGADVEMFDVAVDRKDYTLVKSRYVCRGGLIYGELVENDEDAEVVWLTDAR